jgi:hypothetical protein
MDTTRRHIFVSYSNFNTLGKSAKDQDPTFVSGQHQDVSGQHQTHLGWATGQSKEKKRKAESSFVLLSAIKTHF